MKRERVTIWHEKGNTDIMQFRGKFYPFLSVPDKVRVEALMWANFRNGRNNRLVPCPEYMRDGMGKESSTIYYVNMEA